MKRSPSIETWGLIPSFAFQLLEKQQLSALPLLIYCEDMLYKTHGTWLPLSPGGSAPLPSCNRGGSDPEGHVHSHRVPAMAAGTLTIASLPHLGMLKPSKPQCCSF